MGSYTYETYSNSQTYKNTESIESNGELSAGSQINTLLQNIKQQQDIFPAIPLLIVCLMLTMVYIYYFYRGKKKNRVTANCILTTMFPKAEDHYYRIGSNVSQAVTQTFRELELFDQQNDMDMKEKLIYLHESGDKGVAKYINLLKKNVQRSCKHAYSVQHILKPTDFQNSEKYSEYQQLSSSILEHYNNVYISTFSGDNTNVTMSMLCSLVTAPRHNLLAPLHQFFETKLKENEDDVLSLVFPLEVAVSNPILWVYASTGDESKLYKRYPDVDNLFGVDPQVVGKYHTEDNNLPKIIYNTWAHSVDEKQLVSEDLQRKMHAIYSQTNGDARLLSIYITDCGDDMQLLYGAACDLMEKPTEYQGLVGGKVGKCGTCVRVRWQLNANIDWPTVQQDIWMQRELTSATKALSSLGYQSYRCAREIGALQLKPSVANRNFDMRQKLFDELDKQK